MNYLNLSIILLIVVLAIVGVALIFIVLMQKPKQEGLGAAFGSGVTDQVFGSRTTDVLQKTTGYLGAALFIVAFILSLLITMQNKEAKEAAKKHSLMVESGKAQQTPAAPTAPAKSLEQEAKDAGMPTTPAAPVTPAPSAPAAPAAPQP